MKSGHLRFLVFLLLNLTHIQEREKERSSFLVLLPEKLSIDIYELNTFL